MQFKELLSFIIPMLLLHILAQAHYINHCYQNKNLSHREKVIYIIGIIVLNLPFAIVYLFKEQDEDLITIKNIKTIDIDNHTKHGIFIFLMIAFEIFAFSVVLENADNPYQLIMIILLPLSFFIMIVCNLYFKEIKSKSQFILPLMELFIVIPLEYFDYTYNAHFIMVIVAASIINNSSIALAKTFSITAFCAFLIGSTAKAFRYYGDIGIEGTASFLYISVMIFLFVIVGFYSLKKNLLTKKRLVFAIKIVNEQSKQLEEVGALAERSRITAEIHDNVGHRLTGAVIIIEAIEKELNDEEVLKKLIIAKEQIKRGLEDVRLSVRAIKDQGTTPFEMLLENLVFEIKENTNFIINYVLEITSELLSIQQHMLLQTIKECATNSIKHGKCNEADLLIQEQKGKLYFTFSDSGLGIDSIISGFGLNSIQERVECFGGTIVTESMKNEGFTVNISIPIGENHGGSK